MPAGFNSFSITGIELDSPPGYFVTRQNASRRANHGDPSECKGNARATNFLLERALEVVGQPDCQRQQGEHGIRVTAGRKNGRTGDVEIADPMHA